MSKRTSFSSLKKNDAKKVAALPLLKALVEKSITIYAVSTVVNVSFESEYILNYSLLLKKMISTKIKECEATVDLVDGLPYSLPALNFKILSGSGNIKYESLLLTLSDDTDCYSYSINSPLLCVIHNADVALTKLIHTTLEQIFSCCIRPCSLTNNKFLWLIGITINESIIRKINEGINIGFTLPNFSQNCTIHLQLTDESLENLWLSSRPDVKSNVILLEEIEEFFHGLLLHIKNTYGINLEECLIKGFNLQGIKFYSGKNLQMSVSSGEIIYSALSFLYSDCT